MVTEDHWRRMVRGGTDADRMAVYSRNIIVNDGIYRIYFWQFLEILRVCHNSVDTVVSCYGYMRC